jgi:hypothetical protein
MMIVLDKIKEELYNKIKRVRVLSVGDSYVCNIKSQLELNALRELEKEGKILSYERRNPDFPTEMEFCFRYLQPSNQQRHPNKE